MRTMTMRRTAAAVAGALFVAGMMIGQVPVSAKVRPETPVKTTYALAPGVKLTTIKYPTTPNQVRVLTVIQGNGRVPDVFPAGPSYPAYKLPSQMGAQSSALAAVNGDFALADGRPAHLSMIDGELWSSGIQDGSAFALTVDGSQAWIGHPSLSVNAIKLGGGAEFRIARYNAGKPSGNVVAAYSKRAGIDERPPGDPSPEAADPYFCAARLVPDGAIQWAGAGAGRLARTYTVDSQPDACSQSPLIVGAGAGNVVIATRMNGSDAASIVGLAKNDKVRLTWGIQELDGAVDVIGGQPMLVSNGTNVAPAYDGLDYFLNFNPRTGVGINAGCTDHDTVTPCKIFIVTVDGRVPGWSKGMRLPDFANVFIDLGATWAVNLDGGGGTVMWVKKKNAAYCERATPAGGCLVTRPSDSTGERLAVLGLGAVAAPDPGEPATLR